MKKLPDQFDGAILGVVQRCGEEPFVAYDEEKLIDLVAADQGIDRTDAAEHVEVNMVQAWIGEDGPGFVMDLERYELTCDEEDEG